MVKWIPALFSVIAFSKGFSQASDSMKCWEPNRKLTWSDFKGKIDKTSSYGAICPSRITVYPVGDSVYHVRVTFFRYEAWAKIKSPYPLAHEQLHFDITELYARKVRKIIKELFKGEYSGEFADAVTDRVEELEARQKIYDKETAHGGLRDVQAKWWKHIYAELETLNEYASTAEDCLLKK